MAMTLYTYFYTLLTFGDIFSEGCGVEMVTRQQWGARTSRDNETMEMPVSHLFIHHTAMNQCNDFDSCSRMMRAIQNFHMDDRGWDDIGYNFLIGGDGKVYQGRGWTRVGAHTYGFNRVSVAFSLMGNFVSQRPPQIMLDAAQKMIQCAKNKGFVVENYELHGHRDAGCTECPGQMLYDIIKEWDNFVPGPLPGSRCWRPQRR